MAKSVADYSSLFYFNPLASWVYDLHTFEILDVNQAALSQYGYSKEEFLSLNLKDLRPPEEVPKLIAALENLQEKTGNIYFGIFTHKKKSGDTIKTEINGHKVDFDHKNCMLVICRDISDDEEQLSLLKASETKLKAASSIANLGYWRLEVDANSLSWTDEVFNIWGRNRNQFELTFENFVQTIHPDDKEAFEEDQRIAFAGGKNLDMIHRIVCPDRSVKWVHELGRWVKDEKGKLIAFEGTVQDITSRKVEEQRLKLLESVITNTKDAVLITEAEPIDEPGPKIIYVNKAFTKMTGYEADEVIGKSPRILQGSKTDKQERAKLSKAIKNWQPYETTVINYKKTGEEFWVNFSISPVADESGWFTHWIAIQKDVTEQKNKDLEKELLAQISINFNFENDYATAASHLCETISNFGKFDLVELWTTNLEKTHLHLLSHCIADPKDKVFYSEHPDIPDFKITDGLQGKVWLTKKQLLWNDIDENKDFVRKETAKKTGLKSVLGIPLIASKETIGVLLIGTKHDVNNLKKYARIFRQLEGFIGSEINRKKLENDLNHLYGAIPDILCLVDFQGRFLKMNKSGYQLLGYTEEDILHQTCAKFVHPEDKDISINEILRLSKEKTTFKFENRYITKNGSVIWLSWTGNADMDGGIIYATAKNITEEKALRELTRQASKLAKIGSWEIDFVNSAIFWSHMVHQLHETDPTTFFPDFTEAINFYREDFRSQVESSIGECMVTGEPFDLEAVLVTEKKNERWVRVIGEADMVDGKCKRIYGSFQDIHDRKEAEIRLQSLADNLPGVVFQYLIYPDGTDALKYVTKGAEQVWGFRAEEVIQNNQLVWNQISAGGEILKVQQSIGQSIQNKTKWASRWKYIMPNGEQRTHAGYGSPDFLTDGTILFNSVILDVTQEAKNEELLRQATGMAKIGSWELDLINREEDTMYWSPMTRTILECDEHYNPSLTHGFEFYTESSKACVQRAVETLIKTGQEFDEELLLITAKGTEKWVRCIGKSERANHQCTKIYGSLQEIHASKMLELQIREILGSISDAFYALNKNWEFTYFNKEAERLLHRKEEDICGLNMWQVFPEALGTPLERNFYEVAETGKPKSFEYLFPGDGKWYEINAYPSNGGVSAYFKNIDDRKKAAEELQQAHDEKHRILESIGDAFFTIKKDFEVTYWNKTAERLLGVKREDIVGKNLWQVFPDALDLPSYSNYKKALETNQSVTFEDFYGIWMEVNAHPSADGLSVFFRDISGRKEAAENLKKAFDEKSTILESIGDAFFALDRHWTVTYWNKEAEKTLGRSRTDVLGKNLWEAYADAIDSDFYRQYHKAIETGNTVTFEEYYPALCKWFEVVAYPSKDGLSVYFKDITLRKEADIRLLEANERFEKATEATRDAIWDWDIANKTFYRSHGIEKFFGEESLKSLSESAHWKDKFHPEDLPKIKESIYRAIADPLCKHWELEYRIGSPESIIYVVDRGVIIRNSEGKALRMVGAMTDLTERKHMEIQLSELNISLSKYTHELERSNEELEQFAFITSHDLQEPLRMITSFMDLLKRKYGEQLDEKAHQYIHFATDGAKRMKQIILELLEYSRASKPTEGMEKVDMNEILQEFKQLRHKIIVETSATILSDDLPTLKTYKAAVTQILHCLVDNAIKYVKKGELPVVEIRTTEKESEWEFAVKDNGIGIEPKFFDKIFIIFQRLHNKDQYEGTGIGLSIAKRHVEYLNGRIWLKSTPGVGSIFCFTIPKTE